MSAPADGPDVVAWVVDVGNTRTAFGAVRRDGSLAAAVRVPTPRATDAAALPWTAPGGLPCHGVCVVAAARDSWTRALAAAGVAATWWGDASRPFPVRHPYAPPTAPGADRLAAALAAWKRLGGRAVVVDAGSALTVDAVSADGAFLGGAIAPGFRALAAALAGAAPALAAGTVAAAAPYPATSTADAVAAGLHGAARGLVRELVTRAEASFGGRAPLVVTGGDADLVAGFLGDRRPDVVPELTLEGVALAALGS
ncbi:MAG TPA: type III pantothenate kinase [Planctomycetota bacterium]|nr:type III pantothenate kinase [Planctomycetota bacterium]